MDKATEVKKLREKTGMGMLDCKKALEEAQGDESKALDLLREKFKDLMRSPFVSWVDKDGNRSAPPKEPHF